MKKQYSSLNPNPIDKQIGERLALLRKSKGFSQQKLGTCLNVTFQQVQKYENGSNRLSGSTLYNVCVALETTPNILLDFKE